MTPNIATDYEMRETMPTSAHQVQARAQRVVEAAKHLFVAGVMSHGGHANLSARLDANQFLLTTVGAVRELRPDQLATVRLDGKVVDGELAPENAEIVAMHSVIYRTRDDVGGIIHTHSPAATAFALANRPLPCRTEPLLRFGQAEDVPVVAWGPRGSDVSVRGIAEVVGNHPTTAAVLLANHGLLVFGPDPMATAQLVVAIEESAEAEVAAAAIGGAMDFPAAALAAVRESMARVRS
jgi:L-fuculose-phosphate aldolase